MFRSSFSNVVGVIVCYESLYRVLVTELGLCVGARISVRVRRHGGVEGGWGWSQIDFLNCILGIPDLRSIMPIFPCPLHVYCIRVSCKVHVLHTMLLYLIMVTF